MLKRRMQNVLVAVDGSTESNEAAEYAIDLAKTTGSKLKFVHVIEDIKMGGVIGARAKYGDVKLVEGYNSVRKSAALKWMERLENAAKNEGVAVVSEILYDTGKSITGMIVEYAKKNGIDLIVVGNRGHSRFRRLVVGSVASGISKHAECPVLIVR